MRSPQDIVSENNVMQNDEMKKEINRESVHLALAAAGLTPGVGIFADAADTALYLAEGEYGDALFSSVAMIPFVGQYAGSLRLLEKAKKNNEPIVKFYRGVTDVRYEKTFEKDAARMKASIGLDKKVPEGNIIGGGDIIQARAGAYTGTLGRYGSTTNLSEPSAMMQRQYFGVDDATRNLPSQALYTSTNPDIARLYATKGFSGANIPADFASRKPLILEFEVPVSWLQKNSNKILSADKDLYDMYKLGGPGSKLPGQFQDMTVFDLGLPKGFLSKVHRYDMDELRMSRGTSVFSLKPQKGHISADKLTSTFDDMRKAQQKSEEGYKQLFEEIRKINEMK